MHLFNRLSNHPFIVKRGPTIALLVAVLCLLTLIITTGFEMRAQARQKVENYTPQAIKKIQQKKNPSYRINDIVNANLFGNPKPKIEVKNAPKTTLDLTLKGILSATDSAVARAIVQSGRDKKTRLYSIGDEIKGAGASIKEIRALEIILNRNGAIESLPLQKKTSKGDNSVFTPIANDDAEKKVQASLDSELEDTPSKIQTRKIRKPKFSALDRALEKLEDI